MIPAHSTRGNNDLTTGGGLKLSVGFNNTSSNDTYYSTSGISGGLDQVIETGLINVVQREDDNITGSTRQKTIIASRFSAPGGVEVQTYGYLDAYAHEYSVHNSLNFRNQPVKNNSGESGTIRVNSHANRREGLNTLYKRHTGKFGYDSTYGSVSSSSYDGEPSFHKVHRNLYTKPIVNSKALRLGATSTGLASMSSTVDTTIYGTTGSISLSFWMKLDRTDGNTTHIYSAMDTDGDISQRLYYKSGYLFWLFYREDSSNNTEIGSFSLLLVKDQFKLNNLLEWNHIAVAWNGLDDGAGRLYLNGAIHHTDSTFNAPYAAFSIPDVKNSSRAPASIHLYDLGNASSFYEE